MAEQLSYVPIVQTHFHIFIVATNRNGIANPNWKWHFFSSFSSHSLFQSLPRAVSLNHCSVCVYQWIAKDDWNEMHIATRHSATWRNTYQPQILPYILNIVTLTAIAYSSKRIYWHRAILLKMLVAECKAHCKHTHTQCTWTHPDWKWQNLQSSSLGVG